MKTPIRVLHLEDSPRDADIIRDQFEVNELAADISVANNRAAFEQALSAGTWDVILCDYNVPGYSGLAALQAAREKHPSIPVIMISGTLSPEEGVECLHAGATDYLLKQRPERLASAVRHALDAAEERARRQETETKLIESEERFRQLAEQSSEGFWFSAADPERVTYVNPAIERMWGLPAETFYKNPRAWMNAIHPEDQPRVRAAFEGILSHAGAQFHEQFRVVRPDGSIRWLQSHGTALCNPDGQVTRHAGTVRDITEQKEAQRQLLHSQRLESLGTLASGIAHDLNNALAPIIMSAEIMKSEIAAETPMLDIIHSSAKRAAGMVRQLLTFAKGAEGARVLIQPYHLIKEMRDIIKATFPKNITLTVNVEKNLPTVLGDPTQLHQILLNLAVNARDAMPDGGALFLAAEAQVVDTLFTTSALDAKPGHYVVFRVTDSGSGIPPEILDRIFEPFFTTKPIDKGTGLGLSTVLGIVKSHGGFMRVNSKPQQGSTFEVYLPVADRDKEGEVLGDPTLTFKGDGQPILFVDDEQGVREVARAVLQRLDFKVFTAIDGAEGLIQLAHHGTNLAAIISDVNMPAMDGFAFVNAARRFAPDIPIIITSGRLTEMDEQRFQSMGVKSFLSKPFTQIQLAAILKQALRK